MIDIQYEPSEKNKWRSIANANTTRSQTKTRRDAVALMESQAAEGFQKEVMLKQKKTMNSTDHCCKQYHVVILLVMVCGQQCKKTYSAREWENTETDLEHLHVKPFINDTSRASYI